ncbi:MAG TPA: GGDEF domain-containing protein [Mycobacteriales bacterium]|nr:GGDEF domain-containing protein [Mycobacteriales bacterium]
MSEAPALEPVQPHGRRPRPRVPASRTPAPADLVVTRLPAPQVPPVLARGVTGPTALALFYLLGGLLTLASAVLPGWDLDRGAVLGVAVAALASGALVLALRSRLSDASCHVLVGLGALLIGAAAAVGGGGAPTAAYSSYYFFVGLYAALFFAPRAAAAHVTWAAVVHVAAVSSTGTGGVVPATVVLFGGIAVTAVVVGALVRQVRAAAATDPLTRLPNRRAFDQHLAAALGRSERSGRPLALLALDLDGFKAVNDREGHAAGDRLLVATGGAWLGALRRGDVLARTGGDEFVVLLPDADLPTARQVAGRLVRRTPDPLGVSVGVALSRPGEGADGLLRRADAALYRHKRRR